jgi:hypothetical protein
MALSGSGGYRTTTTIPEATFPLNAVYTRHIFARSSVAPATTGFRFVCGMRGGFNSNFSHDEFAWDHTGGVYVRSNYHRAGGYVSAQMSAGSFTGDIWRSYAATFDGTNVRSYVEGTLDGTSGGSSASTAGNTEVCLNGSSGYGSVSNPFTNGQTAELAIWDVVLNADELAALAKGFRATRIRPNNLVFYAPVVRGKHDLCGGRTLSLGVGSETVTDHPRVFG